jgi:signal transduction histidine kinase
MPRTFQGRLTVAFVAVIALTLALVSGLVINRLDAYFADQQQADLASRTRAVAAYVAYVAERAAPEGPVVGADNRIHPGIADAMANPGVRDSIANVFGQADVIVRFGLWVPSGERPAFVPADDGTFEIPVEVPPSQSQHQEAIQVPPTIVTGGTVFAPYAAEVTLVNPYTVRATAIGNVTGLLAAIGVFALGLSVVVAAALARRFTNPLRQLTDAASALAEGDLGRRVPIRRVTAGSSEIAELAVQFNAMADRVEESVEIIRRDRDRSRDFLADVSHELRTPLAALRTFNDLLKERAGDDPDARAEFLESSGQQIERLDWLAQNLLELSKLDSGLVLLDLRPDDLRAAVETAIEQSTAAARKRGITLRLGLPAAPVRVRHDPQRIGQVVANLVANAIKFTPRGGSVGVDLSPTPDGARIEVSDTGVGIDPAELPHIFERFYRGSRANEARGSGSGLGLAIVRSIVDMHGGTVAVESHVGQGSRFVVELPRDPRLVEGTPAAERSDVASAAAARGRGAASNVTETSPSDRPQVNPEPAP